MRRSFLLLLLAVAGCGGLKSQVMPDEAVDFRSYRRIGVQTFGDKGGKGEAVALAIDAKLQRGLYEPVDFKAMAEVLAQYKPDRDLGFGAEALEIIRAKTGADALLIGRMAPDWSTASITMVELHGGAPILRALLRPRGRKKKVFATPEEVADEFARVYRNLP